MEHSHGNPNSVKIIFPLGQFTPAIQYWPNKSEHDPVYKQDAKWFAAHKNRQWVIRKVITPEFDELDAVFGYKGGIVFPPQLWCFVCKHPRLGHRVLPCWRGTLGSGMGVDANGYLTADSDDLIGHHLEVMASSFGINDPEFRAWHEKWCDAKRLWDQQHASVSGSGQVH